MSISNIWDAYQSAMAAPGTLTGTTTTTSTSSGPLSGVYAHPAYKIKKLEMEYKKAIAAQNKREFIISLDGNIEDTKTIFAQALDAAREGCEVTIKVTK